MGRETRERPIPGDTPPPPHPGQHEAELPPDRTNEPEPTARRGVHELSSTVSVPMLTVPQPTPRIP